MKTLKNHSQQPHHFNQKNLMTEITSQIRPGIFTHQLYFYFLSPTIAIHFFIFLLSFFSHVHARPELITTSLSSPQRRSPTSPRQILPVHPVPHRPSLHQASFLYLDSSPPHLSELSLSLYQCSYFFANLTSFCAISSPYI
jgi:hypothetical protein